MEENEEVEYVSDMEMEAMAANELFMLFTKSGFTENQALKLIAFMMKANFDEVEEEE